MLIPLKNVTIEIRLSRQTIILRENSTRLQNGKQVFIWDQKGVILQRDYIQADKNFWL